MPLPGAISPAETGEIRARGEARRSEVDQSILQGMVRFGDVNVANKGCTTSRCNKAIVPPAQGLLTGGVSPALEIPDDIFGRTEGHLPAAPRIGVERDDLIRRIRPEGQANRCFGGFRHRLFVLCSSRIGLERSTSGVASSRAPLRDSKRLDRG